MQGTGQVLSRPSVTALEKHEHISLYLSNDYFDTVLTFVADYPLGLTVVVSSRVQAKVPRIYRIHHSCGCRMHEQRF